VPHPRTRAEVLPPPPDLPTSASIIPFPSPPRMARGRRQRSRAAANGEQQAGRELFSCEVADGAAPFSDHHSQGGARLNPKIQIRRLRTGDPRPDKPPATNKQKKKRNLTTPAPPLVHLWPAIPAERTRARPGLCRWALSYCRLEGARTGE
jgi:hypothetical protein